MNRTDIETQINAHMEERLRIMRKSWKRWDAAHKDATPAERLKALQRCGGFTEEEFKQLKEVDETISGLRHMLGEGFFAPERPPKDPPAWVKAVLY